MLRPLPRGRKENATLDSMVGLHYQSRGMLGVARVYFFVFGLLTIVGGVMGYVKAQSTISLVAGAITGLLLLVAAYILPEHTMAGLIMAGLVSLLLAGQFLPKFFRTHKMMPAGLMAVLSVIGLIVAIVSALRK